MIRRLIPALLLLLLAPAQVAAQNAGDDLVGRLRLATLHNEPVADVARAHDLGTLEVLAANWGLDPWRPESADIVLPTAHLLPQTLREGIVINRAEYRLYYFVEGQLTFMAPIGVGREGDETPLGETTVVRKQKDPFWFPTPATLEELPELPPVMPPGPDNPLGAYALYLGWPAYLIHGTNDLYAVGRRFTRGCVRLFPDDIEELFTLIRIGTRVTVIDQSIKLGWHEGELFLEAHPDFAQLEELRLKRSFTVTTPVGYEASILAAAGDKASDVDWFVVRQALERRSGVPVQITRPGTHPVDIVDHDAIF